MFAYNAPSIPTTAIATSSSSSSSSLSDDSTTIMHTSGLISRKRKLETDEDISQINNDPLAKGFLESFNERRKRVRPNDDIRPTSTFTSLWRTDSNKKLPKIIDFSSETYVCFKENCNSRSFTWSDLCLHVQEQHSEKCASCGELLICQAQIDHHRKIHESPKGFVCGEDGCEKIFSTKEKLGMHFNFIHVYNKKHMCLHDDCGRWFAYKSALERHELSHVSSRSCINQTTQ
ncbi:hypothetical protein J3Q64DRAFT_1746531 [Phycomyces blakesleeanus]|uniref:C2H2-type domain-containing protein n=1 Tax=Phycomyces blakesleeanus TaxID=4837 RepID=A0ABR3AZ03_PHYBL